MNDADRAYVRYNKAKEDLAAAKESGVGKTEAMDEMVAASREWDAHHWEDGSRPGGYWTGQPITVNVHRRHWPGWFATIWSNPEKGSFLQFRVVRRWALNGDKAREYALHDYKLLDRAKPEQDRRAAEIEAFEMGTEASFLL